MGACSSLACKTGSPNISPASSQNPLPPPQITAITNKQGATRERGQGETQRTDLPPPQITAITNKQGATRDKGQGGTQGTQRTDLPPPQIIAITNKQGAETKTGEVASTAITTKQAPQGQKGQGSDLLKEKKEKPDPEISGKDSFTPLRTESQPTEGNILLQEITELEKPGDDIEKPVGISVKSSETELKEGEGDVAITTGETEEKEGEGAIAVPTIESEVKEGEGEFSIPISIVEGSDSDTSEILRTLSEFDKALPTDSEEDICGIENTKEVSDNLTEEAFIESTEQPEVKDILKEKSKEVFTETRPSAQFKDNLKITLPEHDNNSDIKLAGGENLTNENNFGIEENIDLAPAEESILSLEGDTCGPIHELEGEERPLKESTPKPKEEHKLESKNLVDKFAEETCRHTLKEALTEIRRNFQTELDNLEITLPPPPQEDQFNLTNQKKTSKSSEKEEPLTGEEILPRSFVSLGSDPNMATTENPVISTAPEALNVDAPSSGKVEQPQIISTEERVSESQTPAQSTVTKPAQVVQTPSSKSDQPTEQQSSPQGAEMITSSGKEVVEQHGPVVEAQSVQVDSKEDKKTDKMEEVKQEKAKVDEKPEEVNQEKAKADEKPGQSTEKTSSDDKADVKAPPTVAEGIKPEGPSEVGPKADDIAAQSSPKHADDPAAQSSPQPLETSDCYMITHHATLEGGPPAVEDAGTAAKMEPTVTEVSQGSAEKKPVSNEERNVASLISALTAAITEEQLETPKTSKTDSGVQEKVDETKEVTEEVTKEETEEVTKEVTKEGAEEVTKEETEEVTKEVTKEETEEVTKEGSEEGTKEVTKEVTKEGAKEVTKDVTKEGTKELTKEETKEGAVKFEGDVKKESVEAVKAPPPALDYHKLKTYNLLLRLQKEMAIMQVRMGQLQDCMRAASHALSEVMDFNEDAIDGK